MEVTFGDLRRVMRARRPLWLYLWWRVRYWRDLRAWRRLGAVWR